MTGVDGHTSSGEGAAAGEDASPDAALELRRDGAAAVVYHDGADLPPTFARRPFLTATMASGRPVTEVRPDDHLHHLGLSAALPDVNGTTFWGGRTFVRGQGSTLLDNHGVQRVRERELGEGTLIERLDWLTVDGEPLIDERRTITVSVADGGWRIAWVSELTAVPDVSFGSPQTNGRDDAFYGGLFWRAPFGDARTRTSDGEGEAAAQGSRSPWLSLDGAAASLVAATTTDLPWFVRSTGYTGFCPAVAVQERRMLAAGETLRLDLAVALLDSPADDPAALAEQLLAGAWEAA